MIIGESAESALREGILAFLGDRPEIAETYSVLTFQLGEGVMLAVKARMRETGTAAALIEAVNRVEADLRQAFPLVQWCFFEPDNRN
jgi:uncharacterized ion transporter superfamily protein YfcC